MPAPHPERPRAVAHAPRLGPAPRVRNLHLTVAGDAATSVVVQWSTDADTLASEVRIGEAGRARDEVVRGYSFTYPGGARRRQHEVHVCGLAPGRRYAYDAGGEGARSGVYEFTTAPAGAGEVRVMVAGDARTHPAVWARVAARAREMRPDALVFTGDAVGSGSNQGSWDAFFAAGEALLASTPALWVDGNHEGASAVYYGQFALPSNGNAGAHERWYASTYGPLRVVVLNDVTAAAQNVPGDEASFLDATLAAVDRARTPFVLAAHHRPIYTTSSGNPPNALARAAWAPLFDRHGVDVVVAGHVHCYESSHPIRGGAVAPDGRGTHYFNFGGAGAPLYRFRARAPWLRTRESTHGFAVLTATATRLRWEAFRLDGSRIESLDLAGGRVASR